MLVRVMLAALALLSFGGVAHAGEKVLYQPAPAWVVAAPPIDVAKLTDADPALVVLDQQERIEGGRVWTYTDRAFRVVSPQMLNDVGTMTLTWQPDEGDIAIHRIEILRGGERIDLVAKGQSFEVLRREQQLEALQINGMLTATLAVNGLQVGDVLRLSYSVTSRDKALGGNVQTSLPLMTAPARVGFARTRLSWPSSAPLAWRMLAGGPVPQIKHEGGYDIVEITLPLAKPDELPDDAPVRFQKLPMLEASSFAGWESVSRAMAPLYDTTGLIAPGSPLAAEVDRIRAKSSDPRVRAALALRLVQDEVRYLFLGMEGGNYIPQSPAETWSRRYGDCKAKTLLLLAILHELGIESEPLLVNSSLGDLVPSRLPSAAAFDHVIVQAVIGGKPVWLDGTSGGARLADLDDTVPFRNGLPLRKAGTGLEVLPMRAPARPLMEATVELDQSAGLQLPTPFTVTFTMRGPMAEMLRTASTQAEKEQLDQMAQGMATGMIGESYVTDRSLAYDPETATATLVVRGLITSPWKVERGSYRATFDKSMASLSFAPDRARPAWKDIPVMIAPIPLSTVMRMRVHLPSNGAGFTVEGSQRLPAMLAGVRIVRKTALADGWLTVEDRMDVDGGEIAAADLPATRAAVAQYSSRPVELVGPVNYPSRIQVIRDARRTNALAPILAMYAKAIADDPKDALGYTNRANFLAGVWDWNGAIKDIDAAIAIEPSASLYLLRARLRQTVGDDKGALADAEAALALDPGAGGVIRMVAIQRFRTGNREPALAMLRERMGLGGKERLEHASTLSTLLVEARRGEEALAVLDDVIRTNPGNAKLLNQRCWVKGTANVQLDTGLRDCTRAIELAENPSSIYDSRAMIYFRMGRYPEALEDLNAALDISPDLTASTFLRGIVHRRMGKIAESDADLSAARFMSPRVDEDYGRWGIKP